MVHHKAETVPRRIFITFPFSTSIRSRALSRLLRLSSTSYFRICAFVSLFLIISSTTLLFTALTSETKLLSLLPLPHKLRNSWSAAPGKHDSAAQVGEGPLIPRICDSDFSTNWETLDSNESIYVLSLPHRTDRRTRMELLRNYLSLNWTYIDATYVDEEVVSTIMGNVFKLREEAMRARLELQRIRDEKAKTQEQEDGFVSKVYPDDLEAISTLDLPLSEPVPLSYGSSKPNQLFSGVKLPFQWPSSTFTNNFELPLSHSPLKTGILEFLEAFDIYANKSDSTLRTWRIESDISNKLVDGHDYFSRFLTNVEARTNSSSIDLELVCPTKDFSLVPYSTTLPYHKCLTSARVAVWYSHLRVLQQIVEEEDLRQKREIRKQEWYQSDNNIAPVNAVNLGEVEEVGIAVRGRTEKRWIYSSRCEYGNHPLNSN
ncbi:hypothetical protein J3R30DRAFT_30456 [Lentinula aciculospora]|uniref:Uncharacterized protein n=1 Tax=Lentinula aciculospora TaxID=153920 RepID=A0A9W9ATC4_9AGAR|nr:hypothetical protein J3R30DRAFT_30456 [Lentinula aciculospora]